MTATATHRSAGVLPQAQLEEWVLADQADLKDGKLVVMAEGGASFPAVSAVHFVQLVSGDDRFFEARAVDADEVDDRVGVQPGADGGEGQQGSSVDRPALVRLRVDTHGPVDHALHTGVAGRPTALGRLGRVGIRGEQALNIIGDALRLRIAIGHGLRAKRSKSESTWSFAAAVQILSVE